MDGFTDIWQYMPHGMCLLWQPWLVLLWAGSDLLIFLSYSAIPLALFTVLRKRKDVPHSGLVVLFGSFILLCGLTHLMGIVTLWYPIYPWVGLLKLATGIVSFITAITLFRLIPVLVSLPSPGDIAETNERLREEIAAHEATLASLEAQVTARTQELSEANAMLAVQAREAVHRSSNLLSVVSSLAQQSARGAQDIDSYVESLLGRIRALATATTAVMRGGDHSSEDLEKVVREQLEPLLSDLGDGLVIQGDPVQVGSEAAQQIALALHELATNSRKHGVGKSGDGAVSLRWRIAPGGTGDRLLFEWQEDLPGGMFQVDPDRAEGFGTKLLTKVVPIMLKGESVREHDADSFTYRLDVPLAAIAPDRRRHGEAGYAAEIVDRNFGLT